MERRLLELVGVTLRTPQRVLVDALSVTIATGERWQCWDPMGPASRPCLPRLPAHVRPTRGRFGSVGATFARSRLMPWRASVPC